MDEWRQRLLRSLLSDDAVRDPKIESIAALETAMARARAEIAYLIEIGRHHRLPIMGGIAGNDVWVRLGHPLLRFVHDRPAGTIRIISMADDLVFRWDERVKQLVESEGGGGQFETALRSSIDALVHAWKESDDGGEETVGPASEHPTLA